VTIAMRPPKARPPVFAARSKADLEERLPATLGTLARIGKGFPQDGPIGPAFGRPAAATSWLAGLLLCLQAHRAVAGWQRRRFENALRHAARHHASPRRRQRAGHTFGEGPPPFVGGGPGDPELLNLSRPARVGWADVVDLMTG